MGHWHGRISTWRLSGCAAEASVERNESFGVSTHNRWQHETWSGDCTDPSPEARALGCLRRFSFLRPVCASAGSLLLQTNAYSSASPGAACPKCPPLRTDQKQKPPLSGEGVVFSARFSNLDLISHLSDTDRCELLVQIPSMPLVQPCGDATGFRRPPNCRPPSQIGPTTGTGVSTLLFKNVCIPIRWTELPAPPSELRPFGSAGTPR